MYSQEHFCYLRRKKRYRVMVHLLQVVILFFLLGLWQVAADFQWINTFISSSPKEVMHTLVHLHQTGDLYYHIWVTVYETIISFGVGTFLGCLIATLLWWNPFLAKVMDPYLTVLNSLPKVALGPIIIIWCGAGIQSIIFMALLISLIITIINVYQGFISMDNNKIKLLRSFRATKFQIYRKLILPGSMKSIVSSLKINVSMSLIGITTYMERILYKI